MLAWRAATRAAKANEKMVTAQHEANRLHGEEIELLRRQRADDETVQARMVNANIITDVTPLAVVITNDSFDLIRRPRLIGVIGEPDTWQSQVGNALRPAGIARRGPDVVEPRQWRRFKVEFVDETGIHRSSAGDDYTVIYRFTDAEGRRWQRTWRRHAHGEPELVAGDDSDLANDD